MKQGWLGLKKMCL